MIATLERYYGKYPSDFQRKTVLAWLAGLGVDLALLCQLVIQEISSSEKGRRPVAPDVGEIRKILRANSATFTKLLDGATYTKQLEEGTVPVAEAKAFLRELAEGLARKARGVQTREEAEAIQKQLATGKEPGADA